MRRSASVRTPSCPILLRTFRDDVQDATNDYAETPELPLTLLDRIQCGQAAAEDEQDDLANYFLETEEFRRTLDGNANLIIGRKGSGKTAICLQVRDRVRAKRHNIVVDLNPEGYQLIKLKELINELTSQGYRKEFVAAFWQYVLWLEIAYKILEKDAKPAQRDAQLLSRYHRLQTAFQSRVDTGTGDFSERLRLLTNQIATRFAGHRDRLADLKSSDVLQIVYGADVATIREEILSYLKLKGVVLFLFDNLARMRTPGGFDSSDGTIILGLVESLQEIAKRFRRAGHEFRWAVFIRSDVYEFVVRAMPDYGKHAQQSLEWQDRVLLTRLLQERITSSLSLAVTEFDRVWPTISVPTVRGMDALDLLVEAALMRPRYLIRLFESAKRRAINLSHQKIVEADYEAALDDLGWTIIEDLNLELRDIVTTADNLLFDLGQLNGACGIDELRTAIAARVGATDLVKRVTDVLLWSGAMGITIQDRTTYIYNCGYKLGYLHSLTDTNPDLEFSLHPTLARLLSPV
jgi:hypothetical protein